MLNLSHGGTPQLSQHKHYALCSFLSHCHKHVNAEVNEYLSFESFLFPIILSSLADGHCKAGNRLTKDKEYCIGEFLFT